ncbi:MAG: c-type cytochrome, partial [Paracoccaceae bacterium]
MTSWRDIGLRFGLVMLCLAAAAPGSADPAAGRLKAEQLCQTCHGIDGVALVPMAANLSGQQRMYIVAQLEAYRTG